MQTKNLNNKIMGAALRYGNDKIDLETSPIDEINTALSIFELIWNFNFKRKNKF